MVFWKGKEEGKEKLEVKGGQSGLLPIFSFVSQPGPPCRDRVAQWHALASAAAHVIGKLCAQQRAQHVRARVRNQVCIGVTR